MDTIEHGKASLARQYDALAHQFNQLYQQGRERGHAAMQAALEQAREQLTALGEFGAEQGQELKRYLARDLEQTIRETEQLGDKAKEWLNPARLGAGALASLASALSASGDALSSLGKKTREALSYHTGETTSAGTLTCKSCGQTVQLKATGHVPPCPKCHASNFSKGY
ncbi:Zinc-ribbon containing domain-containing protein [Solimonas aquatica]|uniref:Zinc-ribbon containing domain-containing protein n=1 Tax=Solimonas aquatica TaxID=489703 RepID=A0A1H9CYE4_9GAMM|nr:hypothetical protein [Solimonas aquatica]SEQ06276.1 Zinc-ribbon containing domain-containing protein [Solimonas aquatica]